MANMSERKLYPWPERDPIIDIIEIGNTIRVIVALPGIVKEDVWFDIRDGVLVVEVSKYGQVYRKAEPCHIRQGRIELKTETIRNAVLEAVFEKTHARIKNKNIQN